MLDAARARVEALPADARVLDVGGWASPLARADWVLDLLPYDTRGLYGAAPDPAQERFSAGTWVQRDICDRDPWPFADDFFDFAVCSHTLEDVRDPVGVCRELSRVAKAGYVEMPSAVEELTWGVHGPWVGWSHHHWICEQDGDALVFTFKPHLLCGPGRHLPEGTDQKATLEERHVAIWWTGTLPARENVLVGAEELDPWLAALLERHGGAATPARRWFRR